MTERLWITMGPTKVAIVGAGIGGLATAIATVDEGGDVIVADTAPDVGSGDVSSVVTRRRVG